MAKSKTPPTTGSRSSKRPTKKVEKGKKNGSSNGSRAKYVDLESKARELAETAHPSVLEHVVRHLLSGSVPRQVSEAPFWPELKDSLSRLGVIRPGSRSIDLCFAEEALFRWGRIRGAWVHLVYSDGLAHGKLWAWEHATAKELGRLNSAIRDDYWWSGVRDTWDVALDWTPAHTFLCTVWDKVAPEDAESSGKPPLVHGKFEEFWQCFTSTDLEDVRCNLYLPEYIEGFADGALNLSGELRAKFLGTDVTVA